MNEKQNKDMTEQLWSNFLYCRYKNKQPQNCFAKHTFIGIFIHFINTEIMSCCYSHIPNKTSNENE